MRRKNVADSIFIKVPEYKISEAALPNSAAGLEDPTLLEISMGIKLFDSSKKTVANQPIEVIYVGEKIYSGKTDETGLAIVDKTIRGKKYGLLVLGDRKKDNRYFDVIGGGSNEVLL